MENMVEGVTIEEDISYMQTYLRVRNLYKIKDVRLKKARRIHRTTPGDIRIYICRALKFDVVYEDRFRKRFPIDSFKNDEFEDLRSMVVNPTHLADLTGSVLSIARPVHNDDGTMLVIVKIENIRNAIVAINWITTVNDFYSWAETQEIMYPVVVKFTSILVYEPEPNFNLLLTGTNETHLIRGSYIHRYRALLNRYFHEHRPIMILKHTRTRSVSCFRDPLPIVVTLQMLRTFLSTADINLEARYWCLVQIEDFIADHGIVRRENNTCWYGALMCCKDFVGGSITMMDL